jgi:epoxyqueuosine reductase
MTDEAFDRGVERLRANGFGLLAVFDCAEMPDRIVSAINRARFDPMGYQRLVLLGNSGARFWEALQRTVGSVSLAESDHPVDEFSIGNVEQAVTDYWGDAAIAFLYPGGSVVPLQQLGRLAGWHHDSPLGIGINRMHGLWFAYRAAFLIDAPLPLCKEPAAPSPCASCRTHDCVDACPASAVHFSRPIDTDACGDFALAENSPCAVTCRAREACPVAANDRYHREQITYHYRRAVAAIRRVRGSDQ